MSAYTRLIYTSQAADGVGEQHLNQICDSAVRNNARENISGVLLFSGGRFFQLLEGEGPAVDSLYFGKILQDPRHVDHRLLLREPCEHRLFPNWSMGRLFLDQDPGSAQKAWDQFCAELHRQSPEVAADEDPAIELICQFIDHFGDECDQALQAAWVSSLKTVPAA